MRASLRRIAAWAETESARLRALARNLRRDFRYEVAIGAYFKNEARYLDEWLAFHHGVGVTHFYLYNDGSDDDYRDVLAPWQRRGLVSLIDWPTHGTQVTAYNDCIRRCRKEARWLALIDIDEFLFSPSMPRLPEALAAYRDVPAIFVYWVLFGSSGHVQRPAAGVIDSYTRCLGLEAANADAFDHRDEPSRVDYVTGWAKDGKSIVNPRLVRNYMVHKPQALWWGRTVDERRRPPQQRTTAARMTCDMLRINHYWAKSHQDLAEKVAKGSPCDKQRPKSSVDRWLARERHLNGDHDETILPLWHAIRKARAA